MLKYSYVCNFEEEKKQKLILLILKNIEILLNHCVYDQFWQISLSFLFSNNDDRKSNFKYISSTCADVIAEAIELSLPQLGTASD